MIFFTVFTINSTTKYVNYLTADFIGENYKTNRELVSVSMQNSIIVIFIHNIYYLIYKI